MRTTINSRLLLVLAPMLLVSTLGAQTSADAAARSAGLTPKTFRTIFNSIQPRPAEVQWRAIDWWLNLSEALVEARKTDKPILLWAMNGHPCGMT